MTAYERFYCDDLNKSTKIQGKWQENMLNCRVCKRRLVTFIGHYFLQKVGAYLKSHQSLYVAGCFDECVATDTAWFVSGNSKPQPNPAFTSNAEETDTRLWVHARKTTFTKILVMSPDTDVYLIGLPLFCASERDIIVQVSPIASSQLKLLHLKALVHALQNDPDLAHIDQKILPKVFQALYVVTGCDYISFFSQVGKASFMRYFYQYASFISSAREYPGTLADTCLSDGMYQQGYLAFLRLIGTVYFKKHCTGFDTQSPISHFQTFKDKGPDQHLSWLDNIRQNMWFRVKFENEMVPSNEALLLHWKRACWVIDMWSQADQNTMKLQPITNYGWTVNENMLSVSWDSESNMKAVRERVSVLFKGCKCATGCKTKRCGCRKGGNTCSVGCDCKNCKNQEETELHVDDSDITEIALDEEIQGEGELEGDDIDYILDWVFGNESQIDERTEDSEDSTDSELTE